MLIIRRDQLEAFQNVALHRFEDEMVAHCFEFSPKLCDLLGESQVRVVIRNGIENARQHELTLRGPVRLYIEMMFLFGSAFDTDPQYEWALQILGDVDRDIEMRRAERLHENTLEYLDEVAGPDCVHTWEALHHLRALSRTPPDFGGLDFATVMLRGTATAYPRKYAFVGEDALRRLIDEGVHCARLQGFSVGHEAALLIILMFAFGHGCLADPLYPWIARTLVDENIPNPASRARRLEKKAITWLDRVLAADSNRTTR